VIRVVGRIQCRRHRNTREAIGAILVILTALVQHDITLVVELLIGERRQEVTHAIRLHPQREIERAGRHHLPVVRAIDAGRAVEQSARALERRKVAVVVMLGAFEHQVFEQVGESGSSRPLVLRTDVIPDIDGDHRQLVVFVNDDVQAVRKRFLRIGDLHQLGTGTLGTKAFIA